MCVGSVEDVVVSRRIKTGQIDVRIEGGNEERGLMVDGYGSTYSPSWEYSQFYGGALGGPSQPSKAVVSQTTQPCAPPS